MQRYIVIRIIQAVITSLILVTLVFAMIRTSGSPLVWLVNPRSPAAAQERVKEMYGLDKPLVVQYQRYIVNMFKGDFGDSFVYKRPVLDLIMERAPASIELSGAALLLAIIVAIPIGVYSAVKRGKFIDIAGRIFAFLGMSAPTFWVGLMGIYLLGVKAKLLPVGGRGGIESLILPTVVLAWGLAAGIARLARSGMMDVLNSDYITMARAKGVSEQVIIWKHAFKNASIPVVTMITLLMIIVLSGTVVTETIFAWPGLGRFIMTSVLNRDYPVVQGVTIVISFTFIVVNLLGDIIYAYLNPKIRYQR
jgi:peptide/nickel transport system permease protein